MNFKIFRLAVISLGLLYLLGGASLAQLSPEPATKSIVWEPVGLSGSGLWLSRDNGRTWKAFDELPFTNIQRVEFDPTNAARLHVTTFGGSVWRGPVLPR